VPTIGVGRASLLGIVPACPRSTRSAVSPKRGAASELDCFRAVTHGSISARDTLRVNARSRRPVGCRRVRMPQRLRRPWLLGIKWFRRRTSVLCDSGNARMSRRRESHPRDSGNARPHPVPHALHRHADRAHVEPACRRQRLHRRRVVGRLVRQQQCVADLEHHIVLALERVQPFRESAELAQASRLTATLRHARRPHCQPKAPSSACHDLWHRPTLDTAPRPFGARVRRRSSRASGP
jgi:hypothetical protein